MPRRSARLAVIESTTPKAEAEPTQNSTPSGSSRGRRRKTAGVEDGSHASSPPLRLDFGDGLEGRRRFLSDPEFCSKNPALRVSTKKDRGLKPQKINLHHHDNKALHHTREYQTKELVVRRGQAVILSVNFDRELKWESDEICLQLTTGNRPQESKGTVIRLAARSYAPLNENQWGLAISETIGNEVKFSLMFPSTAIVGKYQMFVETSSPNPEGGVDAPKLHYRHKCDTELYVLFNPWCKGDAVYLASNEERKEYVLNDNGIIFTGGRYYVRSVPWNFGQFEEPVLDCALYLLSRSCLQVSAYGNPVKVCRAISAMANYNDKDGGVLVGRWTEHYPRNTNHPVAWTGSNEIMDKFWKKKYMVKYGQCVAFAGIVTTICRALGIPSRCVTSYDSGHDTDASHTIDYHFTAEGKPIEEMNDVVWNYHVFNEGWMRRTDLPPGYDGWQAFDATPQETSEGIFQCGPASVRAIRDGALHLGYDASFMFGEINGDRAFWTVQPNGHMSLSHVDSYSIGRKVLTKTVGAREALDLTGEYKLQEGSAEGLALQSKLVSLGLKRDLSHLIKVTNKDVRFRVDIPADTLIGQTVQMKIRLTNSHATEVRSVNLNITSYVSFYTGISRQECMEKQDLVKLQPSEEKIVDFHVAPEHYLMAFEHHTDACLKAYVYATVTETDQVFCGHDVFEFVKPDIKLSTYPESLYEGDSFELRLSFKNPLPSKLTGAEFHLEAPGIEKALVFPCRHRITPNCDVSESMTLTAARLGSRSISVAFVSDELSGIRGYLDLNVGPASEKPELKVCVAAAPGAIEAATRVENSGGHVQEKGETSGTIEVAKAEVSQNDGSKGDTPAPMDTTPAVDEGEISQPIEEGDGGQPEVPLVKSQDTPSNGAEATATTTAALVSSGQCQA